MKDRLLAFLVVLLVCMFPVVSYAEEETETEEIITSGDWYYYFEDDGTVTISGWRGENEEVVVPGEIDGLRVATIGKGAFINCDGLTSIEVPDSVTMIEDYAFYGCDALKNIEIPDSVIAIGDYTFSGCNDLTIIVETNSYAEQNCKKHDIQYNYPDDSDSLNE